MDPAIEEMIQDLGAITVAEFFSSTLGQARKTLGDESPQGIAKAMEGAIETVRNILHELHTNPKAIQIFVESGISSLVTALEMYQEMQNAGHDTLMGVDLQDLKDKITKVSDGG